MAFAISNLRGQRAIIADELDLAKIVRVKKTMGTINMPTELTVGGRDVLDAILDVGRDRVLAIGNRRRIETPHAADMYALNERF